jgi:hypothetical protein
MTAPITNCPQWEALDARPVPDPVKPDHDQFELVSYMSITYSGYRTLCANFWLGGELWEAEIFYTKVLRLLQCCGQLGEYRLFEDRQGYFFEINNQQYRLDPYISRLSEDQIQELFIEAFQQYTNGANEGIHIWQDDSDLREVNI